MARQHLEIWATADTEAAMLRNISDLPEDDFADHGADECKRIYGLLGPAKEVPVRSWSNQKFLIQLFPSKSLSLGRLCVQRTHANLLIRKANRDDTPISWEELQQIKDDVGFGDYYCVEIYPPNADCVNVSNMRHLWLVPTDLLPFAWHRSDGPNFFNNRAGD